MTSGQPLVFEGESSRQVVAVVLAWRGRLGLFKRSAQVGSDAGLWHCVTGFVEDAESPIEAAARELLEETGLSVKDLSLLRAGQVLALRDHQGGRWTVHTFLAETDRRRLQLNYEHDAYRWVDPQRLARFDGQVAWLRDVLRAVAPMQQVDIASDVEPNVAQTSTCKGKFSSMAPTPATSNRV